MSPMRLLFKIAGHGVYYADRTWFAKPGIYVWTGHRNVRVVALPKRGGAR